MARIIPSAAGLEALRRRLADLPQAAQAAVGPALHDLAGRVGDDLKAVLPADAAATIRVEDAADGVGCHIVIGAPVARELEFGTSRSAARPVLRPLAAAAAERAGPALSEALRTALAGSTS